MTSTGNTPAVATSPGSPPSAFTSLREANVARQAEWDTSAEGITLAYAGNELAGEVGEACNLIKKLERERLGIRGSRATVEQLAEELADVVICTDLIALRAGIDLDAAVVAKFNATSEKVGLSTRLARAEAAEARLSALTAERDRMAEDAARYRYLRSRDLDTVDQGGVFIGVTPDNLVINEEDADRRIDAEIARQALSSRSGTDADDTGTCNHPACGCDFDAVCNSALSTQSDGRGE